MFQKTFQYYFTYGILEFKNYIKMKLDSEKIKVVLGNIDNIHTKLLNKWMTEEDFEKLDYDLSSRDDLFFLEE